MPTRSRATLIERIDSTPTLARFRIAPEGGVPPFAAGQFVPLGLRDPQAQGTGGAATERIVWRPYSIASPPHESRFLELYVRLVDEPRGHFTPLLWKLPLGGALFFKEPRGKFTLDMTRPDGAPDERRLLLISSGTGIAPFVAQALHLEHVASQRSLIVCHGASTPAELGYRDLFRDLERRSGGRCAYLPTVSRPLAPTSAGWTGRTGRVETLLAPSAATGWSAVEELAGELLAPATTCVYVCGYPELARNVAPLLEARGFASERNPRADGSVDYKTEVYG